jgi:RNA polymerase sigma-70 factor (ECF subfamily)
MSLNGVSLAYLDASEESDLIEAAQTGDREGYLRLVRQYRKPLYRAAYSMVRDAEKAEALTREVFVRAWQRIHDFPRGQRFFPWLLRAARGLFPTPQVTTSDDSGVDPVATSAGPGTDTVAATASETVPTEPTSGADTIPTEASALAAFAELRPDEQMALSLRLLERLPYEEIGAILDLSLGVVTLRLSQARGHLLPRAEALPPEQE